MPNSTDIQQVCLNGHQITDSFNHLPNSRKKYCPKCGEETITQCPACKEPIPGYTQYAMFVGPQKVSIPSHCHSCGASYPWTVQKKSAPIPHSSQMVDNPLKWIEQICSRFHCIAQQLRERHQKRETLVVKDEYDVQDLLHSLLNIHFDDIRTEEWTPSYAGKSARMDFLLKGCEVVIEVKKTRKGLGAKEVGTQLIEDIARYKNHQDCKTLVCFVYDPDGEIKNPRGIENDLSKKEGDLSVNVFIIPKGY